MLDRLSLSEQARIILVFANWAIQDGTVSVRQGRSPMPVGGGAPRIQREASAGRFNAFLRAHLQTSTFETLYRAAGLDPASLPHDPGFPTDWPTP